MTQQERHYQQSSHVEGSESGGADPLCDPILIASEAYEALCEVGASEKKAKATAGSISEGQYLASKEDLPKAVGEVKVEIAELRGEVKTEDRRLQGVSLP